MNNNQMGSIPNNVPSNGVNNLNQTLPNQSNQEIPNQPKKSKKKIIIIIASIIVILILPFLILKDFFRDNEKLATEFVNDALEFLNGAESLVTADSTNSLFGPTDPKYAPKCITGNEESTIKLNEIVDNPEITLTFTLKSPYGDKYDLDNSYIKIKAIKNETSSCSYDYYIYLTDKTYSIGTKTNPIEKNKLSSKVVTK